MSMQLSLFENFCEDKILLDLFQAYFDARKNKRNTLNALAYDKNFEANTFALCDEILERHYQPGPSICFIVDKPVKREIFAADFAIGLFIILFTTTYHPFSKSSLSMTAIVVG